MLVLVLLVLVPVVHRIGPILNAPYWLDESWVALASKASLGQLPLVSSSTPLGWTFLVWLWPGGGQSQRLIPLGFLALAVVAGYLLGRVLGWRDRDSGRLAGTAAAAAALLLPAQFMQHELKQYTADAAVSVLLLVLLAWAEPAWSTRRAVLLGVAVVGGMLVSHAAALTGAAVLGAVLLVGLARRDWRRLRDLLLFSAGSGAGMLAIYLGVDRSGQTGRLNDYWAAYFPHLHDLPHYLTTRLDQLRPALGVPWPLFLVLVLLGVLVVFRLRRPAVGVAAVLLPVVAVLGGLTQTYPLLDTRTSHYLLVTGAVLAGIGVAGAAMALARLVPGRRRWVPAGVAAVLAGAALVAFAGINRAWTQHPVSPGPTHEDVRAQVDYVAEHGRPGDIILINISGQYGFAYYWSADAPEFVQGGVQATGWDPRYPAADAIVIAADRNQSAVAAAMTRARQLAGAGGRIWLIRSHVSPDEAVAWQQALRGQRVQQIEVGPEPLVLIN